MDDKLDDALAFLKSTPPVNRCGIEDVFGDDHTADIKLLLPAPLNEGVHDLFERVKKTVSSHSGDGYRLTVSDDHHIDEYGDVYFYVTFNQTG